MAKTAVVSVPRGGAHDIKTVQKIVAEVYGRLGCPGCYSGIDILFREDVVEHLNVDKVGQISAAKAAIG